MEAWYERWNIEINEEKTRGIYFSRSRRPPESNLTPNGTNIPFINNVKYLGFIFDSKIIWRLHIEIIEAKAFRTFIRVYPLLKSERLSAKIKLALHKALIRSVMTYASRAWEFAANTYLMKTQRLQNKVEHNRQLSEAHAGSRFALGSSHSICIRLHNETMQATSRSHPKPCNGNVRNIGKDEDNHRKYKRLNLGGGQAYNRSKCLDCCGSESYWK
jgi:hypothetical protein